MAFNGSGTFNRLYNWVNDRVNGIKILATRMDAEMDGFATGLSTCITKDGQTTPVANLPMGGFKHTGVADATSVTEYATLGQVRGGSQQYYADTGAANAYVITPSPSYSTYVAGMSFDVKIANTNTGSATINVNGLGAKSIKTQAGANPIAGVLAAGAIVTLKYDGTDFQIIGTLDDYALTNAQITGGSITGITDLAIADGGTGASTAAAARTNLFGVSTTVDNTISRYDGVTGAIQGSGVVIDDSNNVTSARSLGIGSGDIGAAGQGSVALAGTAALVDMYNTGAGTNGKFWRLQADTSAMYLLTRTDANGSGATVWNIDRSGVNITGQQWSVNSGTFEFNGGNVRVDATRAIGFDNGILWFTGSGTPEGVVTAPIGSLFSRTDGGTSTTLYVKTSGVGNTGWTAK